MTKLKKLAQSTLWRVMGVAFVLLLFAACFFGVLVILGAMLGAVLAGAVVELFHRDIDEGVAPAVRHSGLLAAPRTLLLEHENAPPAALRALTAQRANSSLRVVDRHFDTGETTVDPAHPVMIMVSVVPDEHRRIVDEYLQAGLVLGMAINECSDHDDGTRKVSVGPGLLRRFALAEKAYAGLGYRPLVPVIFRQLGDDLAPVTDQVGSRLEEGETPKLYADNVRRKLVG